MSEMISLNKTVIGDSHLRHGIVCEDRSYSCEGEGTALVIAVADGHGDETCFRSAEGAAFAVSIATELLMGFTAAQESELEPRLRELSGELVRRWREAVLKDAAERPFTEDELQKAGDHGEQLREGTCLAHAYGSTLIAALWLEEHLLLMQQGDGRCSVLFKDGAMEQPIPWDSACVANVTTSLCDEDADTAIRCAVLDTRGRPVAACWLSSDGVEDAYTDMEGTFSLLGELTCRLAEEGREPFLAYLDEFLPEFSRRGSGDDISLAVIAELESCRALTEALRARSERYSLGETLLRCEEKLISMSRKYEHLERRCNDRRETLLGVFKKLTGGQRHPTEEAEPELDKLAEEYDSAWDEFDEYHGRYQSLREEYERIKARMAELSDVIDNRQEGNSHE